MLCKEEEVEQFQREGEGTVSGLGGQICGGSGMQKKTDGSTMKEKEQAWMRLADEYNAGAETVRDWRALKTVR